MTKFAEILDGVVTLNPIRGSIIDLARSIRVCIEKESNEPFRDNTVISVLCDSARLINEMLVDKEEGHKRIIQDMRKKKNQG